MLSPGLTMDLLLGVLSDHGYDVSKPGCRSFVTYRQEQEIEAELNRRVIGMMNGLSNEVSFLDNLSLTNSTLFTTDCSAYAPVCDNIFGRDYQLINRVRRDSNGHVTHELPEDFIHEFAPLPEPDLRTADAFNTRTGKLYYW